VGRGFDTSFEAQKGLIHKLARTIHTRVLATKTNIQYEDLFQEACLSYAEALRTYKPGLGITFSAYMGRAVLNNVNRYVNKRIEERALHGVMLFSEMSGEDDEDEFSPEQYLADTTLSVEQLAVRSVEISERIRCLSAEARRIIREIMAPTQAVMDAHEEYLAAIHKHIAGGAKRRNPSEKLSVRLIGRYLGYSREQMRGIAQEFDTVLGVKIHA